MRFRLLHEKQRKVRFPCLCEFDNDSRHIEQVRIAETRKTDVLWRNPRICQPKAQVARNVRQNLRGKSEGGGLWTNTAREIAKGSVDFRIDCVDDSVRGLCAPYMVEESCLFAVDQKVLKKGRDTSRSSGAQRLACIS